MRSIALLGSTGSIGTSTLEVVRAHPDRLQVRALAAGRNMLVPIMLLSQVINGVLLPVVIFIMLRITNDRAIMGSHVNSRLFSVVAWTGAIVTAAMSLILTVLTLWPAHT